MPDVHALFIGGERSGEFALVKSDTMVIRHISSSLVPVMPNHSGPIGYVKNDIVHYVRHSELIDPETGKEYALFFHQDYPNPKQSDLILILFEELGKMVSVLTRSQKAHLGLL